MAAIEERDKIIGIENGISGGDDDDSNNRINRGGSAVDAFCFSSANNFRSFCGRLFPIVNITRRLAWKPERQMNAIVRTER